MIEVAYEDFKNNMDQYFQAILTGEAYVTVCKDGRRIVLLESVDYKILNSAIDIAKLILEK